MFAQVAVGGVEQPVVFKMARGFKLQSDPGARKRFAVVETEFHFNFVWGCHRGHRNSCSSVAEIIFQATCPAWYSGLSSNVPGATLRKRLLRLRLTASVIN